MRRTMRTTTMRTKKMKKRAKRTKMRMERAVKEAARKRRRERQYGWEQEPPEHWHALKPSVETMWHLKTAWGTNPRMTMRKRKTMIKMKMKRWVLSQAQQRRWV